MKKKIALSGSTKHVLAQLTLPQQGFVGKALRHSRRVAGSELAPLVGSMDIILSKFALLEVECLLRRAVTIVRDTSATSSSQSMIQSVCV